MPKTKIERDNVFNNVFSTPVWEMRGRISTS